MIQFFCTTLAAEITLFKDGERSRGLWHRADDCGADAAFCQHNRYFAFSRVIELFVDVIINEKSECLAQMSAAKHTTKEK
jgi:hypothetical protein